MAPRAHGDRGGVGGGGGTAAPLRGPGPKVRSPRRPNKIYFGKAQMKRRRPLEEDLNAALRRGGQLSFRDATGQHWSKVVPVNKSPCPPSCLKRTSDGPRVGRSHPVRQSGLSGRG